MKHILPVVLLVLIVAGVYLLITNLFTNDITVNAPERDAPAMLDEGGTTNPPVVETPQTPEPPVVVLPTETVLGKSANGKDVVAYHVGTGEKEVLVVGGIHGGYSPNTSEVVEQLQAEYDAMGAPEGIRLTFIPVVNPDGADVDSAAGRSNGNGVDINRNFDSNWSATGMWRSQEVSGGSSAFSEPEAQAIRDYVLRHNITAAVVYYSAAGEVFASNHNGSILPGTRMLMNAYADASGYPAKETFDYYAVTGDMTNWLSKEGVPTISVLLTNHADTELEKNKKGLAAVLQTI